MKVVIAQKMKGSCRRTYKLSPGKGIELGHTPSGLEGRSIVVDMQAGRQIMFFLLEF